MFLLSREVKDYDLVYGKRRYWWRSDIIRLCGRGILSSLMSRHLAHLYNYVLITIELIIRRAWTRNSDELGVLDLRRAWLV